MINTCREEDPKWVPRLLVVKVPERRSVISVFEPDK